jgi:hypothetical protein
MKYSLMLRSGRVLNRSEARGCLAANLALPGAGSLAAGKAVGYVQMIMTFAGMIVTILGGIPMIEWCLNNWARLQDPSGDPGGVMLDLWLHLRWPLAGIGLYAVGLAWAALTGVLLLSRASEEGVPPRIDSV